MESVCRGNSTVGSNPTLSAISKTVPSSSTIHICATECYIFCGNCRALHSLAARKQMAIQTVYYRQKIEGTGWRYRPLTVGRRPEAAKNGPCYIRVRNTAGKYQWVKHDTEQTAAKAAKGEQNSIAVFGECVRLLCEQGNGEAAIQIEKLANQLTQTYDLDILCGYFLGGFQGGLKSHIVQRICAEHSAVRSR